MNRAIALSLLCLFFLGAQAQAKPLKVGDPAPGFSLAASDGNTYKLSFFKGKRAVVLAWYPKAYTKGCTVECRSLANNGHLIRKYDVAYFMASVDPLEDVTGFAKENQADFPLLSDADKSVAQAYGVLSEKGYALRQTVYIGKDGTVLKIDANIDPATSAQDIAANLEQLGVAPMQRTEP